MSPHRTPNDHARSTTLIELRNQILRLRGDQLRARHDNDLDKLARIDADIDGLLDQWQATQAGAPKGGG